jgi:hypothetical protein
VGRVTSRQEEKREVLPAAIRAERVRAWSVRCRRAEPEAGSTEVLEVVEEDAVEETNATTVAEVRSLLVLE